MCPNLFIRYAIIKVQQMVIRPLKFQSLQYHYLPDSCVDAAEVEVPIGFINLFAGNADIIQSLSGGGVTEYLLEEQELAGVLPLITI